MTIDIEFPELKEIEGKLGERADKLKSIFEQAGPTTDLSLVKGYAGKDDVLADIRNTNEEMTALRKDRDDKLALLQAAKHANTEWGTESGDDRPGPRRTKSFGRLIAESGVRTGGIGTKAEISGVDVKTLMTRAAGWAPESIRDAGFVPAASAPIMFMDLVPMLPTSQAAVKYMEQTTRTNNAAERAEGAIYGEAAFVLTERSVTVETVGVWLPVTDEQLEDEDEAADMIDSELPLMVMQRVDSQGLVGDGSTPNVRGVNNASGIQTQAKGVDTTMDAIHKGITKVRVTGRAFPNAVVFHPNDWQDIRLTRTADGIYILGNPADPGPMTIWGLNVAQSDNQTENTAVVGDFANYARFRLRRDVLVEKTNSHSDDFVNGKLAIRAGIRCAFVWRRPAAFCQITGI
jgi:HK97 family phage major capsid protein